MHFVLFFIPFPTVATTHTHIYTNTNIFTYIPHILTYIQTQKYFERTTIALFMWAQSIIYSETEKIKTP